MVASIKTPAILAAIALSVLAGANAAALHHKPALARRGCPDYTDYSQSPHAPYSNGPLHLPFQRPTQECRTFVSKAVEKVISEVTSRLVDPDLAMLFTNALPNTLDTTVAWHVPASSSSVQKRASDAIWPGAQSFIITGDINAEWLRDSVNQVMNYQTLAKSDAALYQLILGAINTQSEFIIKYPYCGAFQPPPPSGLAPSNSAQMDFVTPVYDNTFVFECKYELDSLAAFLSLGNQFYNATGSTEYLSDQWYTALDTVLQTLDEEAKPTFDSNGQYVPNAYTWQRQTTLGTETLSLAGEGNPLNRNIGLIRSAFRPSDDATIFGYLIPANAMMSVQLGRTADTLEAVGGNKTLIYDLRTRSTKLHQAVLEYGVFEHPTYGKVFAFEVDGYGGRNVMDDANVPSLLALPYLGFLDVNDETYQNTRKMVLNAHGNPYYLNGSAFHGIGGPHEGLKTAWPMSLLIQAQTTDNDTEIMECINLVVNSSRLGLIHESINVNNITDYTRSWFAWANSLFSQTILKLAEEKPYLIFNDNTPYVPT
ncbi:hypothetical protein TMatcc_002584 [Talaromyces marneffei ATCC 18224]|uniref:DUF1237 domain protein n=1 Tax=Talaromyces marneffei (strain ATCC 18224 / CBS 334.59 / QM 7333) TaxID=441960 RepID=B6Q2V3_TALMQ|nr:uncharacterized protein EYB26_002307 [Talaromyces marneffei]EEA29051.1 DUF1237 domain protein [Talaromyces marneffei ATCC 18224]KAE8555352.1 hypothetical protein EYB25_000047 [Talaromyces marneffei]QGA14651.1 hypothetical protein EYB26_002307 [Talaromyces marneffei]